jgi:hypothetical protein
MNNGTLSGHIQMHVEDKTFDLPARPLLSLGRAVPHDVRALEDRAFLLTLVWPEEGKRHVPSAEVNSRGKA